jgi:hypothetical protein
MIRSCVPLQRVSLQPDSIVSAIQIEESRIGRRSKARSSFSI